MTNFIFLPVPTTELQQHAETWQDGLSRKGKDPCQILKNPFLAGKLKGASRAIGLRCLRPVGANDKLYVMAHGLRASPADGPFAPTHLAVTRPNDRKKYMPSELANVLMQEGLTKSIINVNVYACGSGVPTPLGSWAQRLKDEMTALGYSRVMVTGYLGDVRYSYAYRQTPDWGYTDEKHKGIETSDGRIQRASLHKVRF